MRLDEVRPHARNPVLRPDEQDGGAAGDESWVVRLRGKTGVFGAWRLWPVTVRAVEWWLSARPRSDSPHLVGQPGETQVFFALLTMIRAKIDPTERGYWERAARTDV